MSRAYAKPKLIKEIETEIMVFRVRSVTGYCLVFFALLLLAIRFFILQVVHHQEFHGRSEKNRIMLRALPPSRGLIYDRNGVLLAENVPQFRLELVPEEISDLDKTIQKLSQLLHLSAYEIERFHVDRKLRKRFDSIPLKMQLTETEVAQFAVRRHEFPGVDVVPYSTRNYPERELLAHVIGYVGRIDEQDKKRLEQNQYSGTSHIGKTGIERYYENRLLGKVGYERIEKDVQRRPLRVLSRVSPKQGENLYLSIDVHLQRAAVAAFEGQTGSAVAIDPNNGEILAMVSLPSFDPNLFINGIRPETYNALLNGKDRPLFNRAIQGGYEPGSTMKPFFGLAGLELGLRRPTDSVLSTGEFRIPGSTLVWRDWKKGGHGRVDLVEAISQSVNTYFYQLATDMGIDRSSAFVAQFGFGRITGVDLNGEVGGVLPTKDWKRKKLGQDWYPGETVICGIGQGYWVTTPVQLAHAVATLAMRGEQHTPHLLLATQAEMGELRQPINDGRKEKKVLDIKNSAHFDVVEQGMIAVMHSETGTARAQGYNTDFLIAGKSGTAQRYTRREAGEYNADRVAEFLRHRALFIAWAPAKEPKISVAVVIEHGSSGSKAAAPVARRIIDAYLRPSS
jgi:penicillin-binding protein 2